MIMACDLLQVEDPAPVVAIAKTTTDKWADDQCNGQGAGQDGVHNVIARRGHKLKESGGRKGHRARATDALEGPENYAGAQQASVRMYSTMKSQHLWTGRAVGTHSSLMD